MRAAALAALASSICRNRRLHHFILYSRTYCHLCEDMLAALQALRNDRAFTVQVVDVDTDELLVKQFDELVPVLYGSKNGAAALQLCHYFLDEAKVQLFLNDD